MLVPIFNIKDLCSEGCRVYFSGSNQKIISTEVNMGRAGMQGLLSLPRRLSRRRAGQLAPDARREAVNSSGALNV
jgi:hypothetical protein